VRYTKDMSRWQDDVTAEEWQSWQRIAQSASRGRNRSSYNSSQDLASNVMEKLVQAENRPENVEAWIRRVTTTTYIDMWRARSKFSKVDIDSDQNLEDEFFLRQISETMMGPKTAYMLQESVIEVLGFLSEKHQKLVLMYAAGFTTTEIAEDLAYGSPQAVSNQLRRIQEEVKERFEGLTR
jgi:DNA-directed RNA polymerase specialized sigma24 family protein